MSTISPPPSHVRRETVVSITAAEVKAVGQQIDTKRKAEDGEEARFALPSELRLRLLAVSFGPEKLKALSSQWNDLGKGQPQSPTGRGWRMQLPEFTKFLSTMGGIKEGHCSRYFSAFAHTAPLPNGETGIEFWQLVSGVCAMLPSTPHRDWWGVLRLRYIFRLYDKEGNGNLSVDDFRHMLRHILVAQGREADPFSVEQAVQQNRKAFGQKSPTLSLQAFVQAVNELKFRGTSLLFRLSAQAPLVSVLQAKDPSLVLASVFAEATAKKEKKDKEVAEKIKKKQMLPKKEKKVIIEPKAVVKTPGGPFALSQEIPAVAFVKVGILSSSLTHPPTARPMDEKFSVKEVATYVVQQLLLNKTIDPPLSRDKFDLLSPAHLCALCEAVVEKFKSEDTCVEVAAPCKVFGDIHGQINELIRLFQEYGSPNHYTGDINLVNYIFNGDFVDRGLFSLEVVSLLFSLKYLYPDNIFLVRGNHEDAAINIKYGFAKECAQRCVLSDGEAIWKAANQTFNWLPVAARISKTILCMHGGIGESLETVEQIASIQRPIKDPQSLQLLRDVLWSDPNTSDRVLGVHASMRGRGIVTFGPDRVEAFCRKNNLTMIIRSHQCVEAGYEFFASGHLVTVFSAANYQGHGNDGAMLEISQKKNNSDKDKDDDKPRLSVLAKVIKHRPLSDPLTPRKSVIAHPGLSSPIILSSSSSSSSSSTSSSSSSSSTSSSSSSSPTTNGTVHQPSSTSPSVAPSLASSMTLATGGSAPPSAMHWNSSSPTSKTASEKDKKDKMSDSPPPPSSPPSPSSSSSTTSPPAASPSLLSPPVSGVGGTIPMSPSFGAGPMSPLPQTTRGYVWSSGASSESDDDEDDEYTDSWL